ncbi:MAG: biopolymer transporter ExbD [Sulfuricurvum sp.]|nr:biopolymer transporter ExbD [Sulfuricurvum sp.]
MGFGRFSSRDSSPINDINVVPLVDVLLVLLVVLIVTTPLLMHGVKVELPKTSASVIEPPQKPLTLSIQADGSSLLDDNKVDNDTITSTLMEQSKRSPEIQLLIKADREVPYDYVAKAMALSAQAGITKIGFVNEPDCGCD